MIVKKITEGFVVQEFEEDSGQCIGQEFVCGDHVEWETLDGYPVSIPQHDYFPYLMIQPE